MEQKIETRIETHVNRTGKWVRVHQRGRQDVDDLKNVLVTGNTGTQVPLNEIASIQMVMGPSMISSENGLLRGTVLMNVRGRDVGGFVEEARRAVAKNVSMSLAS